MVGYVDVLHFTVHNAAVAGMTRRAVPVQHEVMRFNNRDKIAKGALQAWQATGNPTSVSLTLPVSVLLKKRHAHKSRR